MVFGTLSWILNTLIGATIHDFGIEIDWSLWLLRSKVGEGVLKIGLVQLYETTNVSVLYIIVPMPAVANIMNSGYSLKHILFVMDHLGCAKEVSINCL